MVSAPDPGEIGNPDGPSGVDVPMRPTTFSSIEDLSGTGGALRAPTPPPSPPLVAQASARLPGSGAVGGEHDRPGPEAAEIVLDPSPEFSDFYRDAWRPVARGLAATLGDGDLAAEATDEAMARAYPRWASLSAYDNPAGWVYRVGLNWARSHHRRLARAIPLATRTEADLGEVADPAGRRALLGLPIDQRAVVVCRLLLDWSVDETAAALRVRPGTVKSRLHRALQTLESELGHLR
jgi:DNA-directed RNA polymerase specialized sigma24 family protein